MTDPPGDVRLEVLDVHEGSTRAVGCPLEAPADDRENPELKSQRLLPEFDCEMANTRRPLERLPDDKLDWTPHEKSFSFRGMATHLVSLPGWTKDTIEKEALDLAPPTRPS